jgi:hypothetical protein
MCSLSWREWGHTQGKRQCQEDKDGSGNTGSNRVFSLFFNDKLPLVGSEFCQLLVEGVSNYSHTYCIENRQEVMQKFVFLSQNHGSHEYLRRCSRVSLTAANL